MGGEIMERIKGLNRYQKGILIIMTAMALVFAVVYLMTISRVGFEYQGAILVPHQENGGTVYSGKIQGKRAQFTVSDDQTVVFLHGGKTYGPYTVKEDSSAIPKETDAAEDMTGMTDMTGVEICKGNDILFRGGVLEFPDSLFWLYNEDGTPADFGIFSTDSDGTRRDENGNVIDPAEPTASAILELLNDPKLTHKGEWPAWWAAAFFCVLNTLTILFADELFRWNLSFLIRNSDGAEPSDWQIAGRYVSWTILAVMAFVVFMMGLK